MPTHNRRPFVAQAIVYFLRQDYPNRELIIVDDGTDPVADLIPDDPRIRYLHQEHTQHARGQTEHGLSAGPGRHHRALGR